MFTKASLAQSDGMPGIISAMLRCAEPRPGNSAPAINCADGRFDQVAFVAEDERADAAGSVLAMKQDKVVALLTARRGRRYTVFKSDVQLDVSPKLARSRSVRCMVDYAEFTLSDSTTLVVEDLDHDGKIDNVTVPLGSEQVMVLQLDKNGKPYRALLFDARAMVYRASAELDADDPNARVKSISCYAGDHWIEIVPVPPGAISASAERVHSMEGEKPVSVALSDPGFDDLRKANAAREEIVRWMSIRTRQSRELWAIQQPRVKRSRAIGYLFPAAQAE
ncbi:MAG: hypothetical protein IPL77_04435 [Flavobacteriales bacterium]|nr:hypothetical protein [Flavobacteriales bacterium]MBK9537759.1 hypothetical protein [Flavobacteriales bacterium]